MTLYSDRLLTGKIALVTMSTSGIGAETSRQLAAAGAAVVVLNGRSEASGQSMRDEMSAAFPKTEFVFLAADITKAEEITDLFERLKATVGGLDILVHSGTGPGVPGLFMDMPEEIYSALAEGFYLSLVRFCRHSAPLMMARGGGTVVAVASDAARVPTPGESVMGGVFAGAVQFTRAFALEMARHQIRANVIAPSLVRDTSGYHRVMSEPFSRKIFEKIQKRAEQRLGLPGPENIAPLAVFLSSSLASHITGQMITVNGGLAG